MKLRLEFDESGLLQQNNLDLQLNLMLGKNNLILTIHGLNILDICYYK
jgi:hypothetical protein